MDWSTVAEEFTDGKTKTHYREYMVMQNKYHKKKIWKCLFNTWMKDIQELEFLVAVLGRYKGLKVKIPAGARDVANSVKMLTVLNTFFINISR